MRQPAKTASNPGRSSASDVGRRPRHKGWVRKNIIMDQRKLDAARRLLSVETETEAVDVALDLVAFREELVRGIRAIRRVGGIQDVFEKPSV
jgi:hypothetical protein